VRIKAVNVDTGEVSFPVPGKYIVLDARLQPLSATLGGVMESCTVPELCGTIDVEADCDVDYEEIGLLTANASANHFNVVFPNLPSGTYQIRARFVVLAGAGASVTGDACAYAGSFVVLGNRIVTHQDVRAVKGPIEPVEID
jgi:hypothetical protein